ncbi:MAG: hypothetical protein LLF83_01115 [Methanobacterium sp.]|nr:hypothetical protein [Methanobacterium sp.]
MSEHKQTEITVDGYPMLVDEGLEDVISNFFRWKIDTCNSCIDMEGYIWIEFCDYEDFRQLLQLSLNNNIKINGEEYKRETLWQFLDKKAQVTLVYGEEVIENPNSPEDIIGTGALVICVGLKFRKTLLEEFKELFFEVLPPE